MQDIDYADLTQYAKDLANLSPDKERLVMESGPRIKPWLGEVTEAFYEKLIAVPKANHFLGDRIDHLKKTHQAWLEKVFNGPYDETYTAYMYKVGDIHVRVNLPVEFMAAGTTLISESLRDRIRLAYNGDCCECKDVMAVIDAALGYSLIIMQKSYQSSMEEQLEKFLKITGITRNLYQNMAKAYKG
jgi:hypothetical protein